MTIAHIVSLVRLAWLVDARRISRLTGGYVHAVADGLDNLSGVARYRQIATVIEREIRAGQWQPGNPAPSRTVLIQRFGVAVETARRAQTLLAQLGYLATVPGVGMIVTPSDRWPQKTLEDT